MNKKFIWVAIVIIALVIVAIVNLQHTSDNGAIKIGIITDLTGPAAYWGESTRAGALILKNELASQDKTVEFIFEDYGLNAALAANAAQKLINSDKVDAIYAEFNPGAIAVGSYLKDKHIPFIYEAAAVSPLKDNLLFYKTYLNYREGCRSIAQKFKDEGAVKIGVLKVNLEFGEICQNGVVEVYGNNMISEGYNLGDTDFRTQLLKLNSQGAQAVINVGFEGDTANTLKVIKNLKYDLRYGTVDDSITNNVLKNYKSELEGAWTFGFKDISPDFQNKLKKYNVSSPYGAALAYTHLKQLVEALSKCGDDITCVSQSLDRSPADNAIGFIKYVNHIADLNMNIRKY